MSLTGSQNLTLKSAFYLKRRKSQHFVFSQMLFLHNSYNAISFLFKRWSHRKTTKYLSYQETIFLKWAFTLSIHSWISIVITYPTIIELNIIWLSKIFRSVRSLASQCKSSVFEVNFVGFFFVEYLWRSLGVSGISQAFCLFKRYQRLYLLFGPSKHIFLSRHNKWMTI